MHQETIQKVIVYIIMCIFIGISQSAGVGGGPFLNICLIVGIGMNMKESIGVTYIFLMGGSLASIFGNYKKINPRTGKPLMNSDLIMITMPMSVCGSIIGTMFNHLISELLLTILLIILLNYLVYFFYKKYKALRDQQRSSSKVLIQMKLINNLQQKLLINPKLEEIIHQDNKVFSYSKIKIIFQIFIYTFIILLVKGGINSPSIIGLNSCGIGNWLCIITHLTISFLFSKSIAMKQFQTDSQKQALGYVFQNQSQKMSSSKMRFMMLTGIFAGFLGGCLALGGALLLIPAWISFGIHRNIATSSTSPLILFSALVAYFLFLMSGNSPPFLLQMLFFCISFGSSYFIKDLITYISVKYNLKGVGMLLLTFTMLISLFALVPYQTYKYFKTPTTFKAFGQFC